MSSAVQAVLAGGVVVWLGERIFGPSAERLGERLATWLFPSNRMITWRLARGLTRLFGRLAPAWSSTRAASGGVLADIDELANDGNEHVLAAISLAWSLCGPALNTRVMALATAPWRVLIGTAAAIEFGDSKDEYFTPLEGRVVKRLFAAWVLVASALAVVALFFRSQHPWSYPVLLIWTSYGLYFGVAGALFELSERAFGAWDRVRRWLNL